MNTCRNCGHDEYPHLPECGFGKDLEVTIRTSAPAPPLSQR